MALSFRHYTSKLCLTCLVVYLGKKRSGNADSVKLELRDFETQEAYGLFSSTKIRSAEENLPKEIEGYLRNQDANIPNPMAEIRATQYRYSATKLSEPVITQTDAGQFKSLFTAEIPASTVPTTKGTFNFELTFKPSTSPETANSTTATIRSKVGSFFSQIGVGIDMISTSFKLRREIYKISRETGTPVEEIKMWYKHESNTRIRDLFFVQNDKLNESSGSTQAE